MQRRFGPLQPARATAPTNRLRWTSRVTAGQSLESPRELPDDRSAAVVGTAPTNYCRGTVIHASNPFRSPRARQPVARLDRDRAAWPAAAVRRLPGGRAAVLPRALRGLDRT